MLTAYDASFARVLDKGGVDFILVGDSLGRVIQGQENTLPVTLDEVIYHTQCVSRGTENAMIVADMPFLSYQPSKEEAIRNTGRVLKETKAQAVKLEGGQDLAETIRAMTRIGIPVMGHIGLQPQSIHALGGYKIQGKTLAQAKDLIETAKILENAGCFSLVLECVTAETAKEITTSIGIPTIGIGAGPHCSGQVLVMHDMLGLIEGESLKHAKLYANLNPIILRAVQDYVREVESGTFPGEAQSTHREVTLPEGLKQSK